LVIVGVIAVALTVIAAVAVGAIFAAAAAFGLRLRVSDAGGDGEKADGGGGEAGLQVHDGSRISNKARGAAQGSTPCPPACPVGLISIKARATNL
jgi:hypothetical protein